MNLNNKKSEDLKKMVDLLNKVGMLADVYVKVATAGEDANLERTLLDHVAKEADKFANHMEDMNFNPERRQEFEG